MSIFAALGGDWTASLFRSQGPIQRLRRARGPRQDSWDQPEGSSCQP